MHIQLGRILIFKVLITPKATVMEAERKVSLDGQAS